MLKQVCKKVQAIDNNFLSKKSFITFDDLVSSLAGMFLVPKHKLNQSYSISDMRWRQFQISLGQYVQFYYDQLRQSVQKLPFVYKLDLQQALCKPRCFCLDISPTMFKQEDKVLWKCNNCKRYLSFILNTIKQPLQAYKIL